MATKVYEETQKQAQAAQNNESSSDDKKDDTIDAEYVEK